MSELIIGRQPVLEALRSGRSLEKTVLLFGAKGNSVQRIRHLCKQRGVPLVEVERTRFHALCPDPNAQGVLAVVATKEYVAVDAILRSAEKKGEAPFLLVLDEIEDPHNLGALIRTAECAGAHGVVIPKHHAAVVGPTVARTSAGASIHLPVTKVTNIAQTLDELKSEGLWIVGADVKGSRLYSGVDYTEPVAIVIGSEGKGMRRLVKEKCDFLVRIPLYGRIESLNASVAGALILYEVARMRHKA
jgi:23S rRNA (guanosine2251-2'-O)-methyltransferase